jgi:hypothetical protein
MIVGNSIQFKCTICELSEEVKESYKKENCKETAIVNFWVISSHSPEKTKLVGFKAC